LPNLKVSLPPLPKTSNIFVFYITRENVNENFKNLTLERDAKISLRDKGMNFIQNVEIPDILEIVKEIIVDPKCWEEISELF
jgi:hypothetical protein